MKPLHQYSEIYNPYAAKYDKEHASLYQEDKITKNVNPIDRELADIEAEKGEIILKPDMSGIYEIKGKRHTKGGTPIKAAPNSFIFSDFKDLAIDKETQELLKLKKGGSVGKQKNTPAEVLKRNLDIEHYNKLINNLSDDNKDVIAKRSSELMLAKYQQILGRVAFAQEEQKQFEDGVPPFSSDTAPVMQDELQENMDEQEQYEGGGNVGGNPFLPKAQRGKITANNTKVVTDKSFNDWGLWKGDQLPTFENIYGETNAANKIDNLDVLASSLGYNGPKNNKNFQQWLYDSSPENKAIIDKWHDNYSEGPNAGMFDGKIGIRWQNALKELTKKVPTPTVRITPPAAVPFVPGTSTPTVGNPFTRETLPYEPNVRRTKEMIVDESWAALEALKVKKYDPYRKQIKSPLVDLNNYDPQNAINKITGAANQAYRATRGLNPYQAQASINEVYGKTISGIADVQGQYDERNISVENQQNMTNNQSQKADLQANVNFDSQYYDQSVLSNQRFDNAKSIAWNQFRSLRNSNQMQLDQLYNVLAQQPIAGSTPVLDNKGNQVMRNGKPLFQSQPLYDVAPGTIRTHLTGAGSIFNENTTNNILDLENQYNQIMKKILSGTSTKEDAIALNSVTRILAARRRGQQPMKKGGFVNPYE